MPTLHLSTDQSPSFLCHAVPLFLVLVNLGAKDTIRILTALQEAYPVAKTVSGGSG